MMVLCVCKCLNVSLESDKIEDNVDVGKLELASMEQRELFFSEKFVSCTPNTLKCTVVQPALISQRALGCGTMHSCLACGQNTHALLQDKSGMIVALIPKSIETTQDRINTLKKSKNFSPVFNLLVPDITSDVDVEMKENMNTSNLIMNLQRINPPTHQVVSVLSKLMNQAMQTQLELMEEAVRQFRDQKYAEFEAYRERAQRDHKILAGIVNKARSNSDSSWNESTLQNGPPSPQLHPFQRRRLSSIKDAKKIPQSFTKAPRNLPQEDDSLDAEDLFDIEGMDDSRNHNMASDLEDYESDDGSNDEGYQASRARGGGGAADIARSLPMNMPRFPSEGSGSANKRDLDDDDYEEPQDIAASIKALARSVHGDVFELPPPRISTQI